MNDPINRNEIKGFVSPSEFLNDLKRREKEYGGSVTRSNEPVEKFKNTIDEKAKSYSNKNIGDDRFNYALRDRHSALRTNNHHRHQPISETHARRISKYAPFIKESAKRNGVPVELICAVILQESGGKANAVSHAGAKGLMQLMPATAKRFGVIDPMNPAQNIEGGTRYLKFLSNRYKGNVELMLAAYNAGEHNVEKYGMKIPPFKETKNYVPSVLAYAETIYDMLRTPANLPRYARKV